MSYGGRPFPAARRKFFEMSERCNISPRFSMKFFGLCNISRTFGFYNSLIKYGGDTTITWLFENDTSAITKKLEQRNFKSNKLRNFVAVIVRIKIYFGGIKMDKKRTMNWIIAIIVAIGYLTISILLDAWTYSWLIWVIYAVYRSVSK